MLPCMRREFGSQRPMDVRNTVYRTLYDAVAQSMQQGLPVAGAAACWHPCMRPAWDCALR